MRGTGETYFVSFCSSGSILGPSASNRRSISSALRPGRGTGSDPVRCGLHVRRSQHASPPSHPSSTGPCLRGASSSQPPGLAFSRSIGTHTVSSRRPEPAPAPLARNARHPPASSCTSRPSRLRSSFRRRPAHWSPCACACSPRPHARGWPRSSSALHHNQPRGEAKSRCGSVNAARHFERVAHGMGAHSTCHT